MDVGMQKSQRRDGGEGLYRGILKVIRGIWNVISLYYVGNKGERHPQQQPATTATDEPGPNFGKENATDLSGKNQNIK